MQIGIYSRKSRLSEKGESISNQIAMCKEYCKGFDLPQYIIYEDEGYSGGDTKRPGFHKMLEDVANGSINAVVCYRLDRISRSVSDFSNTLQFFNQHNVDFLSVKERFDTSSPMGRAMMYISSVFAQLERETIGERLQDNLRRLARTGRWLGGITPVGFHAVRQQLIDTNGIARSYSMLIPNTTEQKIVTWMYAEYITQKSLQKVLDIAKQKGFKSRNNSSYCSRSLRHILSNPVYVKSDESIYTYYAALGCEMIGMPIDFTGQGLHISGRYKKKQKALPPSEWTIATAYHQGFIVSEDFLQVQSLLLEQEKKPRRSQSSGKALLSGILICPLCNSPMYVSYKARTASQEESHYYYRCRQKAKSGDKLCIMKNINGKLADTLVLNAINELYHSNLPELLSIISATANVTAENENTGDKIKNLQEKIKTLSYHLAENPNISASKFIILQMEEYAQNLSDLEEQSKHVTSDKQSVDSQVLTQYLEQILRLTRSPVEWSFPQQKQLISSLIGGIYPQGTALIIKPKKPFSIENSHTYRSCH